MRIRRFLVELPNRNQAAVATAVIALGTLSLAVPATAPGANSLGQEMFGIAAGGGIQSEDAATMERDLDEVDRAGSRWVRIDINWDQIQAGGPDSYNWAPIDRVVKAATDRGIEVLGLIVYTPPWARPSGTSGSHPPDPEQYAEFAAIAVEHYSAMGVHAYEVWNEPNIARFWEPAPDPAAYTELLKAAYPVIKAADPQATVLTAGTAPAWDSATYPPVDFLAAIYENGGGGSFDAVAHHPYCWPALPGGLSCTAWQQMHATDPSLRSVMTANGDAGKRIWVTEFGAPTGGPTGVTEDRQAQMIRRAYVFWSEYDWGGPLFTYTGRDHGTDTWTSENFFGLLRHEFSEKPSFAEYQRQVALADPPETEITSGPSGLTSDPTPTFEMSSSEPPPQFQCRVDSGSWSACTSPHTTQPLAYGDHTFATRAVDPDGVRDPTPATRAFTVAATPSPPALVDPLPGSGPSGSPEATTTTGPDSSFGVATDTSEVSGGALPELAQDGALTANRRTVVVKLACAGAAFCDGDAELSTRAGKTRRKDARRASRGKALMLATARYSIDAGETERVKLGLKRPGRKLLRKQAEVPARLVLRSADGERRNTKLKLRTRG